MLKMLTDNILCILTLETSASKLTRQLDYLPKNKRVAVTRTNKFWRELFSAPNLSASRFLACSVRFSQLKTVKILHRKRNVGDINFFIDTKDWLLSFSYLLILDVLQCAPNRERVCAWTVSRKMLSSLRLSHIHKFFSTNEIGHTYCSLHWH